MNETAFVERRQADWTRLTTLCEKAESSLSVLNSHEFVEMVRLYRRVSTDLAVVRTRSKNLQLADYLNDLAGRAYGTLYRAPKGNVATSIGQGVALAAETVRRCRWYVLVSALIFFGSAFYSYALIGWKPETSSKFVPGGMAKALEQWKKPFDERTASESAAMTGFYLSNNPGAAVKTGSLAAATFGVGTAYLLYMNGGLLGALARELQPLGRTGTMIIWISPHGVPELSGIVLAGAAGFVMGWSLINPGRRRRGDALRDAGKDAIVLLTTGVVMMFIAAPIEGFFSFNPRIPDGAKLAVAAVSLFAWMMFWTGYGVNSPRKERS